LTGSVDITIGRISFEDDAERVKIGHRYYQPPRGRRTCACQVESASANF